MKVAVTGATGHIGNNLTRSLLQRGDEVRVLFRGEAASLVGLDCERVQGDLADIGALDRLVAGADQVYHLAARISLWDVDPEVQSTNVEGVQAITQACLRGGVGRLVHFSSIHAYDEEPANAVLDETRPLNTPDARVPPYDRSKAEGQRVVLDAVKQGLDAVIVQPAGVIGPHDYQPSRMGKVLLSLARGTMPGLVNGGFSWVDVRDVVSAALAAGTKGRTGEAYLLSGHWQSVRSLAEMVHAAGGLWVPPTMPDWLMNGVAPVAAGFASLFGLEPMVSPASLHALHIHRHTSHEKANRELDFTPRPTPETIEDTLAWFAQAGRLKRR